MTKVISENISALSENKASRSEENITISINRLSLSGKIILPSEIAVLSPFRVHHNEVVVWRTLAPRLARISWYSR